MAILVSCSTLSNSKKQPSIVSTKWTLAENVKGNTPTLVIENGKISGNAGCNRYFGTLVLDAKTGSFQSSQVGATRMACENMSVENNFLKMLEQANKYNVSGNTLELYKDKLLLLKFNKS